MIATDKKVDIERKSIPIKRNTYFFANIERSRQKSQHWPSFAKLYLIFPPLFKTTELFARTLATKRLMKLQGFFMDSSSIGTLEGCSRYDEANLSAVDLPHLVALKNIHVTDCCDDLHVF